MHVLSTSVLKYHGVIYYIMSSMLLLNKYNVTLKIFSWYKVVNNYVLMCICFQKCYNVLQWDIF